MGSLSFHGLDDLTLDLQSFADSLDDITDEIIDAQADVVLQAQQAEADNIGMYSYPSANGNERSTSDNNTLPGQSKSYSIGQLASSIRKSKPRKNGTTKSIKIYFAGTRNRSNTRTTNSEIAFLNEYGCRNINARRFIWTANEKSAEKVTEAALKRLDKTLKSHNL